MDKQHGKRAHALLKSASQHLYHIHWSVSRKLSWKKFLLLTCQILALLVNTLAVNEKYLFLNRDNLTIPIQIQLSQRQETFSQFSSTFLKFPLNFDYFEKKKITLRYFVFPILRTPKTQTDKCLKTIVSDYSLTSNMVNVPKHCWNLHQSTFIIFIDHWYVNWVGKSLSYWDAKSWDCLLTH